MTVVPVQERSHAIVRRIFSINRGSPTALLALLDEVDALIDDVANLLEPDRTEHEVYLRALRRFLEPDGNPLVLRKDLS